MMLKITRSYRQCRYSSSLQ